VGTLRALDPDCMSGCNSKYATRELFEALVRRQAATKPCYNQRLLDDPQLSGRVTVGLRIGPDGRVCSADITRNELGDSGVAECVVDVLQESGYPPPDGGCVEVNVPLRFLPRSLLSDAGVGP
jgi:hypothetical protein